MDLKRSQKEVEEVYEDFWQEYTVSDLLAQESGKDKGNTNSDLQDAKANVNITETNEEEDEDEKKEQLRAGLYGFFDNSEQIQKKNAELRKIIQKQEERYQSVKKAGQNVFAEQKLEIALKQAKISFMFINSTNKLFANLVPQVWTRILKIHDERGRAQQVSEDQGILSLLKQHFTSNKITYGAYFKLINGHTQTSDSSVAKKSLDYVETHVHNLIVNILNLIEFRAINTVFDYSLTKAMTPFVLHMFVNGQHVPNICVAFILHMCITVPVQYAQGIQELLPDETAKQVVDVCLQYAYGAIITDEEVQNLQKRYIQMYKTFHNTYKETIALPFSGFETQTWPIDGDVLKRYTVLNDADSGKMSNDLYFNDMQQLLLRF